MRDKLLDLRVLFIELCNLILSVYFMAYYLLLVALRSLREYLIESYKRAEKPYTKKAIMLY